MDGTWQKYLHHVHSQPRSLGRLESWSSYLPRPFVPSLGHATILLITLDLARPFLNRPSPPPHSLIFQSPPLPSLSPPLSGCLLASLLAGLPFGLDWIRSNSVEPTEIYNTTDSILGYLRSYHG